MCWPRSAHGVNDHTHTPHLPPLPLASQFYKYSHQKFWIMDGKSVGMSTGNWSPTDYPSQSYFPPYGSQGWANANRDFTIHIVNERVVDVFANVMQQDLNRGSTWSQ